VQRWSHALQRGSGGGGRRRRRRRKEQEEEEEEGGGGFKNRNLRGLVFGLWRDKALGQQLSGLVRGLVFMIA
jgi:hypothetical protein